MKSWSLVSKLCVLLALSIAALSWGTLRKARQNLRDSENRLTHLCAQIDEYRTLTREQQDTLLGIKPQQDIESRIASVIRSSAISPIPRYSVSVQDDRVFQRPGSSGSSDLREQEIHIRIPGLKVQQIGRFLLNWRENQRIWSPTRIELVHDQRATDGRYTLQLSCAAVYHADGGY